ncbi:MAG: peptidylprolyl isomerase [Bacteroidia bacterium]
MEPAFYRKKKLISGTFFRLSANWQLSCAAEIRLRKLNVNSIVFSQVLVSVIILISACNNQNHYKNDRLRQVRDFCDRRQTDALIAYAEDEDDAVRKEVALAFCSYSDSTAIATLLKMAEFDESSEVRSAAAYALGQFKVHGLYHLLGRLLMQEKESGVTKELAIAVGKSGGDSLLVELSKKHPEYAEGIYYSVLAHPIRKEFHEQIINLLKSDDRSAFFAAATLNRMQNLSDSLLPEVEIAFLNKKDGDSGFQLASILGKLYPAGKYPDRFSELPEITRIGFLRGRTSAAKQLKANEAAIILNEKSLQVQELFAGLCLLDSSEINTEELLKISGQVKFMRASVLYQKAALKHAEAELKVRVSEQLAVKFRNNKNEYFQGLILNAMSAWNENAHFILEQSFATPSIVVRGYGVESLFEIFKNSPDDYHGAAGDLIIKCLDTRDVALCSHAALALMDTALIPNEGLEKYTERINDAMASMKLPRDIETYNDLASAKAHILKLPLPAKIKPEYNHPPDWDLALRIPPLMPVLIETSAGNIEVELFVDEAPATVTMFIELLRDSFYMNKHIHRMVPGFVVQDGCPRGDGFGSTFETIRTEIHPAIEFTEGTLGMASAGNDTESCQWFITHTATPHLNGRYTAFGRVTKGMDVLFNLEPGDEVHRITMLPEKSPF